MFRIEVGPDETIQSAVWRFEELCREGDLDIEILKHQYFSKPSDIRRKRAYVDTYLRWRQRVSARFSRRREWWRKQGELSRDIGRSGANGRPSVTEENLPHRHALPPTPE